MGASPITLTVAIGATNTTRKGYKTMETEFRVTFTPFQLASVLNALQEWGCVGSRQALKAIARDNPYLSDMIDTMLTEMNSK